MHQLNTYQWAFRPAWAALAGGLYLAGLLPAGLFWHRLLRSLGQDARLGETLRAYFIGHLGKYVPGKALVVVLRAGLVSSRRVDATVAAVSVFCETLTMMAVGACLAAVILAAWFRDHWMLCLASAAMAVLAVVPTFPAVLRRIVRLLGIARLNPAIGDRLAQIGLKDLLVGWALMSVGWVITGLSFWAVLRAMGVDAHPLDRLPLYTAAMSLATVAGFLSLIPGGLVVRDAILTELMIPQYGKVVALVSALLMRLVSVLAELAISAILYFGGKRRPDM